MTKPQGHSDTSRGRAAFRHIIGLGSKLPLDSAILMAIIHYRLLNTTVFSNQKMVPTSTVTCMCRCRKIMLVPRFSIPHIPSTRYLHHCRVSLHSVSLRAKHVPPAHSTVSRRVLFFCGDLCTLDGDFPIFEQKNCRHPKIPTILFSNLLCSLIIQPIKSYDRIIN